MRVIFEPKAYGLKQRCLADVVAADNYIKIVRELEYR